mgnify:CR=1 FL=1|tara:strand:+ start:1872 stop:2171 length:300 start_codon:yes stop_codon:yes gene_type:complete
MKTTIHFYEFRNWFEQNRPDNFSRVGLKSLFNYFEEYEDSTGESIEFDPIAFCIEYTEYDDMAEFHESYDKEDYPDKDAIMDYTDVIPVGIEGFIIRDF